MTPSREAAKAVEAIYSRHEAERRTDDPDARITASAAQRALIETLDALGVDHHVFQEFGPSGDFEGFRLKVYAPGED